MAISSGGRKLSFVNQHLRLQKRPRLGSLFDNGVQLQRYNSSSSSRQHATDREHTVLLPLSPMDAVMSSFRLTMLYIFPRSSTNALPFDLERLHQSFRAVIENEYRILLGELHMHPTTGVASIKQTLNDTARTIPFEKTALPDVTTKSAMASLSNKFMAKRDDLQLVTIKATLLSDGGLALGVNMNHTLLDGEGMFTFMKVWGEFYRGVAKEERTKVCHDRSLLFGKGIGPLLLHPEFKLKSPAPPTSAPPVFSTTMQHVFHISPEQIKQIKAVATASLVAKDSDDNNGVYVSTIDVLKALFIILISQARGHGKSVKFTTCVNARKRFSPPLPDNYAGNVILNAFSVHEARDLEALSATSLMNIAKRVRQSILLRDETFLRDAIEFITSRDNLSDVLLADDFFFGPELICTSWANSGMYDADFGGRPWYVGMPKLRMFEGLMIIMDGIRGAHGLDLVVFLETNAMKRLLKLWEQVPFWRNEPTATSKL